MAVPRKCSLCKQSKIIRGRNLCLSCYDKMRRENKLSEFPKNNARHKKTYYFCKDCLVFQRIYGRERCQSCYRKWYALKPENKKRHAELMRQYRREKPEIYNAIENKRNKTEKRKKWAKKHNRKYYIQNKDRLLKYQIKWRNKNRDKYNYYMRNARVRRRNALGNTTKDQWKKIISFYCRDKRCICCNKKYSEENTESKLTIDHIVPLSNGGTHWPDNIQPLCYSCNCSKGDRHSTDYRFDNGDFARSLMND